MEGSPWCSRSLLTSLLLEDSGSQLPTGALFMLLPSELWDLAICQAGGQPHQPWATHSLSDTEAQLETHPGLLGS